MAVVDNAYETKGTHLYFVDTTGTDPAVTKLTCPTGITGVNGGTKSRIPTTCLDETGAFNTYIGGFADASEVSVPFVLYKGDGSHQSLFALQQSNDSVDWMVCLSDGDDVPTMDSENQLIPPADRDSFSFTGYVANLTIDVATNEVVRGTLTIQPSGATTANWTA